MASELLAARPIATRPSGLPACPRPGGGWSVLSRHARSLWLLVPNATRCPKVASVTEEAPRPGPPKGEAPLDGKWKPGVS